MSPTVLNRLGVGLFLLVGIGLMARGCLEERAEEQKTAAFKRSVVDSALGQVADLPNAKVVSVAHSWGSTACGWIHLNPEIGSVPFWAIESGDPDATAPLVLIPRLDSTDLDTWADALVRKQLNIEFCRSGRELPQPPTDAHSSPLVDEAISAFWRPNPPVWVVVPKQGEGYLGIRRASGGGTAISPLFLRREEAVQWTREREATVIVPNKAA